MRAISHRPGLRTWASIAILVPVAVAVAAGPAGAQEMSKKLQREIGMMEDFISDVLIDSPYWLVSSGGPNQGTYLPGYGLVFSFEASLTSGQWSDSHGWSLLRGLGISRHRDRVIIDWDDEDWDDEDDDAITRDRDDKKDEDAYDRWRANRKKRDDRCYARGKEELREMLIDAGDMLTQLSDQDWVVVAVSLDDHRYFRRNDLERLTLRARMSDLRAREAGTITAEQLGTRILTEEY